RRSHHDFSTLLFVSFAYLHSFPTRRSSDLIKASSYFSGDAFREYGFDWAFVAAMGRLSLSLVPNRFSDEQIASFRASVVEAAQRSEEHTSELQSRENIVCRLLLEKKTSLVS